MNSIMEARQTFKECVADNTYQVIASMRAKAEAHKPGSHQRMGISIQIEALKNFLDTADEELSTIPLGEMLGQADHRPSIIPH
jgi:hypothetical protein